MNLLVHAAEKGVVERHFAIEIRNREVPGIVWSAEDATGPRPLVLIGHGGTQHKRVPNVLGLARRLVRHCGYSVIAIDAPGHGDRAKDTAANDQLRSQLEDRIARGANGGPRENPGLRDPVGIAKLQHVGANEWKGIIDHVEAGAFDGVEASSIGYWGVSMGTIIGLPFVASESRVKAAVLGLAGLAGAPFEEAARSLRIPILFVFQWDDELMTRESGLALFDAIGSEEKTMHINPGGHVNTPLFERDAYEAFFRRHLT